MPNRSLPVGLYDIMEQWAKNKIPASLAIRLGGFDDFAELLKTTLEHDIEIEMNLTSQEKAQAARFVKALEKAGYVESEETQA